MGHPKMKKCAMLLLALAPLALANPIRMDPVPQSPKDQLDVIVDVRSKAEYEKKHIKGAINLPGYTGATYLKGCEDQKIGVYCFLGFDRATPAATYLAQSNFKAVYDLGGLKNMDSVDTETGAWNGVLPACANTVKKAYIAGTTQLTGITASDFTESAQVEFKEVIASNAAPSCGPYGTLPCSASDVSIVSFSRRSTLDVQWSLQVTDLSAAEARAQLTTYVNSATFSSDLKAKGGSLANVEKTTVVSAPAEKEAAPTAAATAATAPASADSGLTLVPSGKVTARVTNGDFDIIVDVRGYGSYSQGHIPGALHLPGLSAIPKLRGCEEKKIGVYCSTGYDMATPAAERLRDAGYQNVFDLGGLKHMTDMVTEQGTWDGQLPQCSVYDDDESSSTVLCYLLIAGLSLLGIALLAAVTYYFVCHQGKVDVAAVPENKLIKMGPAQTDAVVAIPVGEVAADDLKKDVAKAEVVQVEVQEVKPVQV